MTKFSTVKQIARANWRAARSTPVDGAHRLRCNTAAPGLAIQYKTIEPVEAYEVWLASSGFDTRGTPHRPPLGACHIRRAVIMARNGAKIGEISRTLGFGVDALKVRLNALPDHLKP